jgi:hypothetical protein
MLNSITAWDLLIASTCASASRAFDELKPKDMKDLFRRREYEFWLDPPKLLRSKQKLASLVARFHRLDNY